MHRPRDHIRDYFARAGLTSDYRNGRLSLDAALQNTGAASGSVAGPSTHG